MTVTQRLLIWDDCGPEGGLQINPSCIGYLGMEQWITATYHASDESKGQRGIRIQAEEVTIDS